MNKNKTEIKQRNTPMKKILHNFDLGIDSKNIKEGNKLINEVGDLFRKSHKGRNPNVDLVLSFEINSKEDFDTRNKNYPCNVIANYMLAESADFDWINDYLKNNPVKAKNKFGI